MRPRERGRQVLTILCSVYTTVHSSTHSINSLWLSQILTVRLIHSGMCIILDPYGNQGKNKETPSTPKSNWKSGNCV